jgi:hypothetical protein
MLWSKKFDLSDIVFLQLDDRSLVGSCAMTGEVRYGAGSDITTKDRRLYAEFNYVCYPIISSVFKGQVIGVLHCLKRGEPFEPHDVSNLGKIC